MSQKLLISLLALVLPAWLVLRGQLNHKAVSPAWDPDVQTIRIRFGVTDTTEKTWTGRFEPESGDGAVVSLRGLHFQPADKITGNRQFEFATRPWTPVFQQVDLSPARPGPRAVFPNGVYAIVKGSPAARFRLSAGANSVTFALADLSARKLVTADGGNIEIELAPAEHEFANPEGEADFPALATGSSGRMALVCQEFVQDQDRLVVREIGSDPELFNLPETKDVFHSAAAYDGQGVLHVVWSAQVEGNWDLYERRKMARGWQPVERLSDAPGADFHHKILADPKGDLWLAWQGFRGGQSDIFLKRFTGGRWGAEIRVSESARNDWEPALAASPDGTVWIGWDSYDRGNYDVFVRSFKNGTLGKIRAITNSPRFDAHASLAADAAGLWIAFDEAEANWGKDYGYLFKDRGNPLYQSRRIRVVRLSGDSLEEPEASLASAFPLGYPEFLQYPQLVVTPDGKLAVVALQLSRADRVLEVWGARGVWENVAFTLDGTGWRRNQVLPGSAGAHDIRAVTATGRDGRVWVAWAADGRSFGNGQPQRQTVHLAPLLDEGGAAGPIRMKPFTEEPELSFPTHPAEAANLQAVRGYRINSGGRQYRILRGDLHRHTSLSGDGVGDGSLWDFYRYVLDAADMDFSTVTDHQGGGTGYNWWKAQKSTDLFFNPGRLTSIYAYERSVLYPNGHRNIVLPKRGAPILPMAAGEQQGKVRSADAVLPYLRQYNALAFRHTIATNQGTDWIDHDNQLEPLVEIYQGHRVVYEHEGGPAGATAEKVYLQRSGYQPAGFFWNALAKGYRMGIQASSDHCSTHISYSCILAEDASREGILDAMRKRHSYGAMDNIILDFRVKTSGGEHLQGDEFTTSDPYTLTVNAIGARPIRRIDVIHNESYAYALTPAGKSAVNFSYADPNPVPGENRYYVRLMQEDGAMAWSSPVWVQYRTK